MKSETQNLAPQAPHLALATQDTTDIQTEPHTELISGQQALVRLTQLQVALDRAAGLKTQGYVSGYRGSPLAAVDKHFAAQAQELKAQGVFYECGLNEDLAATAIWGTQQLEAFAERTVDGVFGLWYGKAPGLDRSIDAIRHANFWGTHPKGGVLAVVGDDPFSQSSSMANYSEQTLIAAGLPVLYPSSVQDLLHLGLLGWALSRHSGLWIGIKVVTDVAESFQSVIVPGPALPAELRSLTSVAGPTIATRPAREFERLMYQVRLPAVEQFLEVAQLNQHSIGNPYATLGVIAAGRAWRELEEALALDPSLAQSVCARKLDCIWPLSRHQMRTFLQRHNRVLVLEEKRAVVAPALRAIAQEENLPAAIDCFGASDSALHPVFGLTSAAIARALDRWLQGASLQPDIVALAPTARESRPPQYCGGCPHQISTHMPEQHRAYAGVGCHYIGATQDWAHYLPLSQMGGEGAAWLGARHFAGRPHVFSNMGDGTYSHSGLLSIRAAVVAGANMTFQILFNRTVAMTGGQAVETGVDLGQLIDQLLAEGVAHVAAVGPMISAASAQRANVSMHGRETLADVRDRLAATTGVTALVYDHECATEVRRKVKRGLAPAIAEHAFIATEVCEGCGDCVTASGCSAIVDHATDLGLKKQVHSGNCNQDLSCLKGRCPSFVRVSGLRRAAPLASPLPIACSELAPTVVAEEMNLVIAGIGGTGAVTLAAVIARAAHTEAAFVHGVNLTGMAQKGGAVVSEIRVAKEARASCSVPAGRASVVLALDPACAGSQDVLALMGPTTTVFCAQEVEGTMRQSLHLAVTFDRDQILERMRRQGATVVLFPARALAAELGGAMYVNSFALGLAVQRGCAAISADAIEAQLARGEQPERNTYAFRLGRLWLQDEVAARKRAFAANRGAGAQVISITALRGPMSIVVDRTARLTQYQNSGYAQHYRRPMEALAQTLNERRLAPTLMLEIADIHYRLLAVKDEYEVARLLASPALAAEVAANFESGAKITFQLAPSWLPKRSNDSGKYSLGGWARPVLRLLAAMRFARGTWCDPFRLHPERRMEQAIRTLFAADLREAIDRIDATNFDFHRARLMAAGEIRGYGSVKMAKMREYLQRRAALRADEDRLAPAQMHG